MQRASQPSSTIKRFLSLLLPLVNCMAITGCTFDTPLVMSTRFFYINSPTCLVTTVSLTSVTFNGVTVSYNNWTRTLKKDEWGQYNGIYIGVDFPDGRIDRLDNTERVANYSIHCENTNLSSIPVSIITPVLNNANAGNYKGHQVAIKDDPTQPSGFSITVTPNP